MMLTKSLLNKPINLLENVAKIVISAKYRLHTLPDLPYDYNALEPVIDAETMKLHHTKHHKLYVENLNKAEEKFQDALAKRDLDQAIALGPALKFNGGGHLNHSIFWTILCPNGTSEPQGEFAEAINKNFGSYEKMVEKLSAAAFGLMGSGWGWLGYNKTLDRLEIASCYNQDPLWPLTGLIPLFGIDVWEHAYYLKYQTARGDYIKNIFKIANWRKVEEYYKNAKSAKMP